MLQNKNRIKQAFAKASISYDSVAKLQVKVGKLLLQQIDAINKGDVVLDLGCGTGFLTQELLITKICKPEQVIGLDLALPMLTVARSKLNHAKASFVCADAEHLPLQNYTVNLVMSNFALQWCTDLNSIFAEIKRVLNVGGCFAFTTFGAQTLHELKTAWRQVDDYAHVNGFVNVQYLTDSLLATGFHIDLIKSETYISRYPSVWDLMAELKQLGAQTVIAGRNPRLTTKTDMQKMIAAYPKPDSTGLIPASFDVISVLAKVN